MKTLYSLVLAALLCPMLVMAQIDPVHTSELPGAGKGVYIHSATDIPIFRTPTSYTALHPESFETLWTIDRQEMAKLEGIDESQQVDDYYEVPLSTIIYLGNHLVDAIGGKVIVNGDEDGVRGVEKFNLFPKQEMVLIKLAVKGGYRLYAINPFTNDLLWKTDIADASGLSQTMSGSSNPYAENARGIQPFISEHGSIVYTHDKDMMLIDPATGDLKWKEKLEPGYVMFSLKGKRIAVVERRSGLGTLASFNDKLGKKLVVIDAETGENSWKKEIKLDGNVKFLKRYKDGFIVVHDEGFNVYDFNSEKGDGLWKKDFSAKEITDVEEVDGNFMVYYKDRRILMDPATGKDVWKKAEKLEREHEEYKPGNTRKIGKYEIRYSYGNIYLRDTQSGSSASYVAHAYTIDEEKGTVVTVEFPEEATFSVGPKNYRITVIDLKSFQTAYGSISLNRGFSYVESVENGYFVAGPIGYVLFKVADKKIEVVKEEKYPEPGAFGRTMAGIGIAGVTSATQLATTGNYIVGNETDMASYERKMDASNNTADIAWGASQKKGTKRADKDYAYFFSKNEEGNLALFQIRKSDGEEAAHYMFDDKTPTYELDYSNGYLYYMNGTTLKIYKLKY